MSLQSPNNSEKQSQQPGSPLYNFPTSWHHFKEQTTKPDTHNSLSSPKFFPPSPPHLHSTAHGSSQEYWTTTIANSLLCSNNMSAWRRVCCVTFLPPPHHSVLPPMANDNYRVPPPPPPPFSTCLCFLAVRSHDQGRRAAPRQDTHTHLAHN